MGLSANRDTTQRDDLPLCRKQNRQVAQSKHIYQGALVGTKDGFLVPASGSDSGIRMVGRAEQEVDNSTGGDGDLRCEVRPGCFKWANHQSDSVTDAEVDKICYASDDQTVAKTSNSSARPIAGVVQEIDADGGVWVTTTPELIAALLT